MQLISQRMNEQLNMLIGKAFAINRMLDRGMSLLMVRWKMIKSSTILHEAAAHVYPSIVFADSISDYQGLRDAETIYPATPIGNREYSAPIDFFKDYRNENLEFEDMIKDAIEVAKEEDDETTKKFLKQLLFRLVPYTALSQDLVDLVDMCGNDRFKLLMLDTQIDDYIKVDKEIKFGEDDDD